VNDQEDGENDGKEITIVETVQFLLTPEEGVSCLNAPVSLSYFHTI